MTGVGCMIRPVMKVYIFFVYFFSLQFYFLKNKTLSKKLVGVRHDVTFLLFNVVHMYLIAP